MICNMDIIGFNYYGTVYAPENSVYKNVTIEYNNITYNSPQISFNSVGLTRFLYANITISDGSLITGNEVAKCNRIEIGGKTNINNYSGASSSNYNITFSNAGSLILNNPKKFVLYNEKANVINISSSIPFDFKFSRLYLIHQ